MYVADLTNCTVRKVTPEGVVTTLAGQAGASGSTDGIGSGARFYQPYGVAVDSMGNIYVADQLNHTIRRITPAGQVTTLAGLAGNPGSADGVGGVARFKMPSGVAVDTTGNIYVADVANDTIRRLTPGGVVTTLAGLAGLPGSADGTGSAARFNSPYGVAVDDSGNIYVADSNNNTIRGVTPEGLVTTLAGLSGSWGSADGIGSAAGFWEPWGLEVDGAGNIYVADNFNFRITKGVPAALQPPQFLVQPQSLTVAAGTNAVFTAAASGVPNPVLLWQLSTDGGMSWTNLVDGAGLSGSSAGALVISNVTVAMTGHRFRLTATNAVGGAASQSAILTVVLQPGSPGYAFTNFAGMPGEVGSADGTGSAARFNYPFGVAVDRYRQHLCRG